MSDIWYYVDNGVAVGPLTLQELKAKLATLSSAKDVLIWCDRFQDWRPAKDVPQFNSQSPPPLPSHEPTIGLPESKLAPANRDMGRIIIVAGVLTAVIAVAGFQYHSTPARDTGPASASENPPEQTPAEKKASVERDYGLSDSDYDLWVARFGSPDKLSDALRFAKEQGVSIDTVFKGINDYGSLEDYKDAKSQSLSPQQYKQKTVCRSDWNKCANNEQLVNNYKDWTLAQVKCKQAANEEARYGDPVWPWLAFENFNPGTNYITSGIAVAIEPNAQFSNGFGAMVHSRVVCTYDLRAKSVIHIDILPR